MNASTLHAIAVVSLLFLLWELDGLAVATRNWLRAKAEREASHAFLLDVEAEVMAKDNGITLDE